MDVCRRRTPGDQAAERIIWDSPRFQIVTQPHSFGAVGEDSDIDAIAMIKAKSPMESGLSHRAHREGPFKLILEGDSGVSKVVLSESSVSIKTLHGRLDHSVDILLRFFPSLLLLVD